MPKFFLVTAWRWIVVEADSQREAIDRSGELDGPIESAHARDYKSARGPEHKEPIEATDLRDAWRKFLDMGLL